MGNKGLQRELPAVRVGGDVVVVKFLGREQTHDVACCQLWRQLDHNLVRSLLVVVLHSAAAAVGNFDEGARHFDLGASE